MPQRMNDCLGVGMGRNGNVNSHYLSSLPSTMWAGLNKSVCFINRLVIFSRARREYCGGINVEAIVLIFTFLCITIPCSCSVRVSTSEKAVKCRAGWRCNHESTIADPRNVYRQRVSILLRRTKENINLNQMPRLTLRRPTGSTLHADTFTQEGTKKKTRSQAVARIADRSAKNCRGHVT